MNFGRHCLTLAIWYQIDHFDLSAVPALNFCAVCMTTNSINSRKLLFYFIWQWLQGNRIVQFASQYITPHHDNRIAEAKYYWNSFLIIFRICVLNKCFVIGFCLRKILVSIHKVLWNHNNNWTNSSLFDDDSPKGKLFV